MTEEHYRGEFTQAETRLQHALALYDRELKAARHNFARAREYRMRASVEFDLIRATPQAHTMRVRTASLPQ